MILRGLVVCVLFGLLFKKGGEFTFGRAYNRELIDLCERGISVLCFAFQSRQGGNLSE